MSGRVLAGGLVLFALIFGAALWWFQTRGYYAEIEGVETVTIDGVAVPVANYRGIDADTSPLKMRACFEADGLAGPAAEAPTPLTTPGWFDCFDADGIARDLASGAATAILAATNEPYGFDRIVAAYPDGRAFQWRQINRCGEAVFQGDPAPEGCPPPPQGYEQMPDFLLELFSEEIPARMQTRAAADLQKLVTQGMVDRGLTYAHAAAFATPRRLTLAVSGMAERSPDVREERKGPRTDAPEKALEGFLRSTGLTRDQLEARDDKKGQVWFAVIETPGRAAAEVLAEVVPEAIRAFPWPRSMRWGTGDLRWVRPLQSIMAVITAEAAEPEVVAFEVGGIRAGAETRGHRFMGPAAFQPKGFDDYAKRLEAAKVILDPEERRARIRHDAAQLAFAQGLEVVEDNGLLEEVAGLVEWPVVLMGEIEEQFLGLPPEVLQTSMKEHQKFFSVKNPKTGRIEKFITVANVETPDAGATILAGNQRVLAARLSDALFFWENDLRVAKGEGMEAMAAPLANVTFHNKLGSQAERIARIAALAREIAPLVGADPDKAERAAKIAKADLSSEMVYEFPELQGIMGKYYAEAAGEDPAVAAACATHYSPLGPSDDVPTEPVAVAVSLADKIDILTGFWAIDEKPTGSKDPYALRRAALGAIRTTLDLVLRIRLRGLLDSGMQRHPIPSPTSASGIATFAVEGSEPRGIASLMLIEFFADRLKVHLRSEGVRHDVIDACFQLGGQDDLVLLVNRVNALQAFIETEDGANLLAGYKRAANILAAEQKKDGVEYTLDPNAKFAEQDEERALFAALDAAEAEIAPALEAEDFAAAMTAMARLRAPIDGFFDKVTVNADNQTVRRNRLCLLNRVKTVMERVAVFSAIEGQRRLRLPAGAVQMQPTPVGRGHAGAQGGMTDEGRLE